MDLKPKTLLRRMLDFARSELERRSRPPTSVAEEASPGAVERPESEPPPRPSSRPTTHLEVARASETTLRVRWALSEDDVARSRVLTSDDAVLCVRLVSFEGTRDDVKREVVDRPCVEPSGNCELTCSEPRGVVSVGLRAGERFVSIVHHLV